MFKTKFMTRYTFIIVLVFFALQISFISGCSDSDDNLIWSDEFNSSTLDTTKWNYNYGYGDSGWGNNEWQNYTSSAISISNGILIITASTNNSDIFGRTNGSITSGRITTRGKFDFQFGTIEARIKLPYSQGMWPAFWMLGKDFEHAVAGNWLNSGEIDIVELVGGGANDSICVGNAFYNTSEGSSPIVQGDFSTPGLKYTLPSGKFSDNFHIFGLKWTSSKLEFYLDREFLYEIQIDPITMKEFYAAGNNFYILLNLAVGGNWPGDPDGTTVWPQKMYVDWVRVYKN